MTALHATPIARKAIYLNGRFLRHDEPAHVSLFDRGYLLGDAIFETLRVYGRRPFQLQAHLARMREGADFLGISVDCGLLERVADEACRRAGIDDASMRITASRGDGPGGIDPADCTQPTISVVVAPLRSYPTEGYEKGIATRVVETRRIPTKCIGAAIKCAHYLPSIVARRELNDHGMIEGIQLSVDGFVAGGTVSNIFLVNESRIVTPSLDSDCLPGITRAVLIDLARARGLPVVERRVAPDELLKAQEVMFTNSLMECLPVASVDGHLLPPAPGPRTRILTAAYRELVHREIGTRNGGSHGST